MEPIDFRGYAGDCLIHGRLVMPFEVRLTDYLNGSAVFSVRDTLLYALEDGRAVVVGDQELPASELWAVEPTDTGVTPWHADLRVPTRSTRIDIEMPPYRISGTLHAVGRRERLATVNRRVRRRQMIPLTNAEVTFVYMGQEITRQTPVVIVNRTRVVRLRRLASSQRMETSAIDNVRGDAAGIATR